MTEKVTWGQALAWRMGRHLLDPVEERSAVDVVRRLGAVLAMDERLADLAMQARGVPEGALAQAVRDGEVFIGFTSRGALHFMAADEGGMYSSVRTANRQWEMKSWVDHYRLAPEDWPDFRATVRGALEKDGPMGWNELWDAVGRDRRYRHLPELLSSDNGGTLIKPLSWQGDLSFGLKADGRRVQSLSTNPHWGGVPPLDEAGPRAVTAYVRDYGPVTRDHVEYWFSKGLATGRKRLQGWWDGLAGDLAAVDVEGTTAYVVPDQLDGLLATKPSDAERRLPGHDQWIMGVSTKDEHVTPPGWREAMTRKANPVITGGVVTGTWSP